MACGLCLVLELKSITPIFQFHPPVPLVISLLLMETMRWREGWRYAVVECGEQFMTQVDGVSMMHKSHVDNWDILQSVSYSLYMCICDIKCLIGSQICQFSLLHTVPVYVHV